MNNPIRKEFGRKGDPRMNAAVNAKLENPALSLYEALVIGGYDYPYDGNGVSVFDSDNIALGQRKNNLNRRLRLARKSQEKESGRLSPQHLPSWQMAEQSQLSHAPTSCLTHHDVDKKVDVKSKQEKHCLAVSGRKRQNPFVSRKLSDPEEELKELIQNHANQKRVRVDTHAVTDDQEAGTQLIQMPLISPATSMMFSEPSNNHFDQVSCSEQKNASFPTSLHESAPSVSPEPDTPREQDPDKKLELAVRLYRSEVNAMYTRCMLLAGYSQEEVQEATASRFIFATTAWQVEGDRLRNSMLSDSGCDGGAKSMDSCSDNIVKSSSLLSVPSSSGFALEEAKNEVPTTSSNFTRCLSPFDLV